MRLYIRLTPPSAALPNTLAAWPGDYYWSMKPGAGA
jgi:hypothetical protein